MKKKVNLALQGGGAHGAFTWGALDTLLDHGGLDVQAISGASAGAMNAVVLADGLRAGGVQEARAQLEKFWRAVSIDGDLTDMQRGLIHTIMGMMDPFQLTSAYLDNAANMISPYQLNPLDINPLRAIVEEFVDFKKLRESEGPKLFIAATNVHTGKIRIFRRPELTADMTMASACVPTVFRAVVIDDIPYWDGGYSGNPALFPLFSETDVSDVILIQINPIVRREAPKSAAEIMNRLTEITFNAPLLGEFRAIEFVARLLDQGAISPDRYKKVHMHLIEGGDELANYEASTRMRPDYQMFRQLFKLGQAAGRKFLEQSYDSIGTSGTMDLTRYLA